MGSDDDADSLFDYESNDSHSAEAVPDPQLRRGIPVASRSAPEIPGLYFFPNLLSRDLHDEVLQQVSACDYFALQDAAENCAAPIGSDSEGRAYRRSPRNQAMLFARTIPSTADIKNGDLAQQPGASGSDGNLPGCSGLPSWSVNLIQRLRQLLTSLPEQKLPHEVKELLFPAEQLLSRQLILNLYNGTEGLASHVDLVNRFADGILLCSFGPQDTGIVMDFTHDSGASEHLFLPSCSVLLLSGEARYDWKHGIAARSFDLVRAASNPDRVDRIRRMIRLSITIRSMIPGADVVGE